MSITLKLDTVYFVSFCGTHITSCNMYVGVAILHTFVISNIVI